MLNPLKHLGGKLNFLRWNTPKIWQLALTAKLVAINKNNKSESTLQQYSVEDIQTLKSPLTGQFTQKKMRSLQKGLFDLQAHRDAAEGLPVGAIKQPISEPEAKVAEQISFLTSKLTTRQLQFLNLAIRQQLPRHFPNWTTLHFNMESPSRRDFELMPTLLNAEALAALAVTPKKLLFTKLKEISATNSAKTPSNKPTK